MANDVQSSTRTQILLVDDDEDIRSIVGEILREDGYEVDEVENGKDALAHLASSATLPDLVLLDMMMPVMTGAEVLDAMAASARLKALPVVILSAQSVSRCDRKSARRVVGKPLSPEALLALVREYRRAA